MTIALFSDSRPGHAPREVGEMRGSIIVRSQMPTTLYFCDHSPTLHTHCIHIHHGIRNISNCPCPSRRKGSPSGKLNELLNDLYTNPQANTHHRRNAPSQLQPAQTSKSPCKQQASAAPIYTTTPTAAMATSSYANQCVWATNPLAQSQPSAQK